MKKRLISLLLLSAALSLTGCGRESRSVSTWTDADGSANKPYFIYTAEDLNAVRGGVPGYDGWGPDKHYVLMRDIDLSGYASGEGWIPIGTLAAPFTGSLDGNGKAISHLTINRAADFQGLFGCIGSGAVVKNAGLPSVDVKAGNSYYFTGGLAGRNGGTISNSYAAGAVSGGGSYTGGLIGRNYGTIINSYAAGTVSGGMSVGGLVGDNGATIGNSYATGTVNGGSSGTFVGGLVGENNSTISNSYATGSVSGDNDVGGLVGKNYGSMTNSYATGTVSGSYAAGGLSGMSSGVIQKCYWITADTNTVLCYGSGTDCTRLTDAQGKQQASFIGWDFVNTWTIEEGVSYPELQWQL